MLPKENKGLLFRDSSRVMRAPPGEWFVAYSPKFNVGRC